ncbi:MAG: hypothetical protein REI45_12130 [Propionicimonas sp.]|nr:hypothetical protein [Propionicimonas sp.]
MNPAIDHVGLHARLRPDSLAAHDLARDRRWREGDDELSERKPFDSIPGLLRARRPALYGALVVPRADDFDYHGGR